MNICVVGAGAVGGSIAVQLARAGQDVSVIARGAHHDAIRANGLTLLTDEGPQRVQVRVSSQGQGLPRPDAIIVAVKSVALASTVPALVHLADAATPIVFALNGLPWWYPYSKQVTACLAANDGRALDLGFLDCDGALARSIGVRRVVGCVIYAAGRLLRPGVVQSFRVDHRKIIFGEPDGTVSARVEAIAQAFAVTELEASVVSDIGTAIWRKLVTNVAQSPICCLTRQPMAVLGRNPELLSMAKSLMREVSATALAWGADLQIDPQTHFGARSLSSPHKPSMLQDLEAERVTEIDTLLLAVQTCARAAGVPTPTLDALTALMVELLAASRTEGDTNAWSSTK